MPDPRAVPESKFPNRKDLLFGREPHVQYLLARTGNKGMTFISGRPKMGKTWLLEETGRRLEYDGSVLVGYHECKGEQDLLLRAVADLYARWLCKASNWQQARSLWERHKDVAITQAGQAVGRLFSGIASLENVTFGKIGDLVKETFEGLARAKADLKSGGLVLPPLAYDQALELVSLLERIAAKRMVLILDAWEKAPNLDFQHGTLAAILSHLHDWPGGHFLIGLVTRN